MPWLGHGPAQPPLPVVLGRGSGRGVAGAGGPRLAPPRRGSGAGVPHSAAGPRVHTRAAAKQKKEKSLAAFSSALIYRHLIYCHVMQPITYKLGDR